MQSQATTVEQYLAELPVDRRAAILAVRKVILKHLNKGYEEGMLYGMIGYYVPHRLYPAGYHCDPRQPLGFAGLASQKNYMSLYMMPVYGEETTESTFRNEWAKTGKKLDMGKCCIRFKKVEDLALDLIGETIRHTPVQKWIEHYEAVLKPSRTKAVRTKTAASSKPLAAKDRRSNHCRIVADAASIRTDAGSVGHDSDCCADPKKTVKKKVATKKASSKKKATKK